MSRLWLLYQVMWLLGILLSSGCHDRYLVRAELLDSLQALPADARAHAELAARRAEDGWPVYLKVDRVQRVKRQSEREYLVETGNGLKSASVALLASGGGHLVAGALASRFAGSWSLYLGPGFYFAAGVQLGLAAILGIAGIVRHPAESRRRAIVDAAAGLVRF